MELSTWIFFGQVTQVERVARVADAMGCGQVLDVESGENQTLGCDFTEEVLLQRFPKLEAMEWIWMVHAT